MITLLHGSCGGCQPSHNTSSSGPNSQHLLQAVSYFTECPDDTDCSLILDLVISHVVLWAYPNTPYTFQLANTAQCAFTGSLFQVHAILESQVII